MILNFFCVIHSIITKLVAALQVCFNLVFVTTVYSHVGFVRSIHRANTFTSIMFAIHFYHVAWRKHFLKRYAYFSNSSSPQLNLCSSSWNTVKFFCNDIDKGDLTLCCHSCLFFFQAKHDRSQTFHYPISQRTETQLLNLEWLLLAVVYSFFELRILLH